MLVVRRRRKASKAVFQCAGGVRRNPAKWSRLRATALAIARLAHGLGERRACDRVVAKCSGSPPCIAAGPGGGPAGTASVAVSARRDGGRCPHCWDDPRAGGATCIGQFDRAAPAARAQPREATGSSGGRADLATSKGAPFAAVSCSHASLRAAAAVPAIVAGATARAIRPQTRTSNINAVGHADGQMSFATDAFARDGPRTLPVRDAKLLLRRSAEKCEKITYNYFHCLNYRLVFLQALGTVRADAEGS